MRERETKVKGFEEGGRVGVHVGQVEGKRNMKGRIEKEGKR